MFPVIDNRAALGDQVIPPGNRAAPAREPVVPERVLPKGNAVEVPKDEQRVSGAQNFPMPADSQWSHFNRRRAELIRRKVRSGLSRLEEEELQSLQRETLAAVDRAFPRPPVNFCLLEELEKRLQKRSVTETS
jgi:hypothetical protein